MTGQALSGLLVVDLTTEIDGPYSTKLLADLGARVVKVEPLEGDPARLLGPFPTDVVDEEASALFLYLNANKESVTADITRAAGRDLIAALAARADILVENFEPGAMAALWPVLRDPPLGQPTPRRHIVDPIRPETGPTPSGRARRSFASRGRLAHTGRAPGPRAANRLADLSLYVSGHAAPGRP